MKHVYTRSLIASLLLTFAIFLGAELGDRALNSVLEVIALVIVIIPLQLIGYISEAITSVPAWYFAQQKPTLEVYVLLFFYHFALAALFMLMKESKKIPRHTETVLLVLYILLSLLVAASMVLYALS